MEEKNAGGSRNSFQSRLPSGQRESAYDIPSRSMSGPLDWECIADLRYYGTCGCWAWVSVFFPFRGVSIIEKSAESRIGEPLVIGCSDMRR